jgi:hypothetical protein
MNWRDSRQLIGSNPHCISGDWTGVHQRVARNRSESVWRVHVGIANVVVDPIPSIAVSATANRLRMIVDVGVVIDIRNVRYVGDMRIGDVDAVEISPAHAVPRDEWLAVAKRAPSVSAAKTNAHAPARATEPGDQRG